MAACVASWVIHFSPCGAARSQSCRGDSKWLVSNLAFPPNGNAVQNGPELSRARGLGAAERTLDSEDRSEIMDQEGKQLCPTAVDLGSVSKPNGCQP